MSQKNKLFPKNLRTEFIGGITTFFTMVYIVIVNPSILSAPGTGMNFNGVFYRRYIFARLVKMI